MAKRRKPGRPGKNVTDLANKAVPGEKKSPGRENRLAQQLRGNLFKRKVQAHTRHSPKGK
ncbi:MAG: hypothetical protein O3A85_04075 [Proteobacteria bacterium]|nr:hypothetical protein [Pseudomonadota bacterium]